MMARGFKADKERNYAEGTDCYSRALKIGQYHKIFFQKSDLFFLCMLRPLSFNIQKQELEIEAAQGGITQPRKTPLQSDSQQGTSFTLQLFQRTLEETLASFKKSIHEDMRNLHIKIIRQFNMQEMETSSVMNSILENQAELLKEVESLRKEAQ